METIVDTASVLALLSQQQRQPQPHGGGGGAWTSGLAARRRVFACKTCGRRFPTFQALGGHRASHRRPKPYAAAGTTRRATPEAHDDEGGCAAADGPRVHGCPVCGLEFAVGQALGGHMRRHRTTAAAGGTLASGEATTTVDGEDVGTGCAGGVCLDLKLATSENCAKCRKNAGLGDAEKLILECPL